MDTINDKMRLIAVFVVVGLSNAFRQIEHGEIMLGIYLILPHFGSPTVLDV